MDESLKRVEERISKANVVCQHSFDVFHLWTPLYAFVEPWRGEMYRSGNQVLVARKEHTY